MSEDEGMEVHIGAVPVSLLASFLYSASNGEEVTVLFDVGACGLWVYLHGEELIITYEVDEDSCGLWDRDFALVLDISDAIPALGGAWDDPRRHREEWISWLSGLISEVGVSEEAKVREILACAGD